LYKYGLLYTLMSKSLPALLPHLDATSTWIGLL